MFKILALPGVSIFIFMGLNWEGGRPPPTFFLPKKSLSVTELKRGKYKNRYVL
jgi:hypothetical protein